MVFLITFLGDHSIKTTYQQRLLPVGNHLTIIDHVIMTELGSEDAEVSSRSTSLHQLDNVDNTMGNLDSHPSPGPSRPKLIEYYVNHGEEREKDQGRHRR